MNANRVQAGPEHTVEIVVDDEVKIRVTAPAALDLARSLIGVAAEQLHASVSARVARAVMQALANDATPAIAGPVDAELVPEGPRRPKRTSSSRPQVLRCPSCGAHRPEPHNAYCDRSPSNSRLDW